MSFARELEAVGGRAVRVATREEGVAAVRRLVGDRTVIADPHPDLEGVADGLNTVADPWLAEVGVTSAVAAVERTGTLALVADRDRPRNTSLVPPVHIALVPVDRMVPEFRDAVRVLTEIRPVPSAMYFITGASHSGDIELKLVHGVHGPREVHVVLYGD